MSNDDAHKLLAYEEIKVAMRYWDPQNPGEVVSAVKEVVEAAFKAEEHEAWRRKMGRYLGVSSYSERALLDEIARLQRVERDA